MTAAEHEGNGRFFHGGDKLGYSETRLNVAAHRVENNEQTANRVVLLDRDKLGDDMLVFGGFLPVGGEIMALYLTYDRYAVYFAFF